METNFPPNLGLELVRATEAASICAGRWVGLGKSQEADLCTAEEMLNVLNSMNIDSIVVIGEESKPDHNSVFTSQQHIGKRGGAQVDLIVDPIDGRTQLAQGYPGAISAAAVAPRNTIWNPSPAIYMEKIIVDAQVAPYLVPECMDAPAAWTLALVARTKNVEVKNLKVFLLDRPRHADLIDEIRNTGAHVMLRPDGDIVGALMVCTPEGGVDLMMGTGGTTEGLLAACAVKSSQGGMLGRLDPQSENEKSAVTSAGLEVNRIFGLNDIVTSDQIFFTATGITDGPLFSGVTYHGDRAETDSLILRSKTHTRRKIITEHLLED